MSVAKGETDRRVVCAVKHTAVLSQTHWQYLVQEVSEEEMKYPERVSDSLSKERDTLPRSPSKRFFVTCGTTAQGHTLAVSKEGAHM